MEAENRLDFDAVIDTFAHPRYELIATGQVHDGEEEVRGYFAATRTAFPDQRNELTAMHSTDDGVLVEFDLLGTHDGEFLGFAPTGRSFRCSMAALYLFGEGEDREKITCERVWFDSMTILNQLGLVGGTADPAA
jgi:predicted ester cyclase